MGPLAKRKNKIQQRLAEIKKGQRYGCWVCGSGSGIKTSRESVGTRCKNCIEEGKTTPAVIEYAKLKAELEKLGDRA